MRIHLLYFAVFRERLGRDEETLQLGDGTTVAGLVEALSSRSPEIASLRGRFRVAVNQTFVDDTHPLGDGDEVALIPPVAGGEDHVRLVDTPPSLDRCVAAVAAPGYGGVVTFTGMVRNRSRGHDIVRLEYEAYDEMAVKVMRELCDEIRREIPEAKLAVEHRVGVLAIGEVAVVIAAAAPHRAEAFAACRALIDRLKDRVPIWKKEIGSGGDEWVGLGP